ncbi:hypothetical protein C8R46DRAFT_294577 [Mycena filopes]|nr:hypothetical protein C8R46DRAFT_294577 [Mycena filopes]
MSVAMLYRTEGLESVKTLLDPVLHPYATRAHQHLFLSVSSSSKEGPAPPVAGPSTHNTSDSPTSQSQDLVRFNEAVQKANRCAEWKYAQATGTSSAWSAEVRVDGEVFGRGEGGTKKVARNEAAKEALGRL